MTNSRWPAVGCGAGLRNKHYSFILSEWPKIDWFEAVTENFMDTGGKPLQVLTDIRKHYPVALHGVSMSIGTTDPPDRHYLDQLKSLIHRIDPFVVSDHLCWTGAGGDNLHDLLPLPFTEEAIAHVVERVGQVQESLNRKILLENISTYVTYKHSVIPEWEFLVEVARRSGCGILLDLNNIYVNSVNHLFDPLDYLKAVPGEWVGQFHLAGHTDKGGYLFDTHSAAVVEKVWTIFQQALDLYGPVSTLIEWDEAIPDFARLSQEVEKARVYYEQSIYQDPTKTARALQQKIVIPEFTRSSPNLREVQLGIRTRIQSQQHSLTSSAWLNPQGGVAGDERMDVYAEGYLARVMEALAEVFETIYHLMGRDAFIELSESYIHAHPSHSYNLNFIGEHMAAFIQKASASGKLPFLSDLARLEWNVAQAFHAVSEDVFNPASLETVKEDDWDRLKVVFQPSVSTVSSQWPILDIWKARHTPLKEIHIDIVDRPQNVLVYRRALEVMCQLIDTTQADLIGALINKRSLGDSCAVLAERLGVDEPPVGEWFSSWVGQGILKGVHL